VIRTSRRKCVFFFFFFFFFFFPMISDLGLKKSCVLLTILFGVFSQRISVLLEVVKVMFYSQSEL
jgi:hypothetical protein